MAAAIPQARRPIRSKSTRQIGWPRSSANRQGGGGRSGQVPTPLSLSRAPSRPPSWRRPCWSGAPCCPRSPPPPRRRREGDSPRAAATLAAARAWRADVTAPQRTRSVCKELATLFPRLRSQLVGRELRIRRSRSANELISYVIMHNDQINRFDE